MTIGLGVLKSALRVKHAVDDDYIARLEANATAYVARVTGRYFGAADSYVEVRRGRGFDSIPLAFAPGVVASVKERAYAGATETTIVAAGADGYEVRGSRLYRKGGNAWSRYAEYVVTYSRTGLLDADAEQAVIGLVAHWYEIRLPVAYGTVAGPVPLQVGEILASMRAPRA